MPRRKSKRSGKKRLRASEMERRKKQKARKEQDRLREILEKQSAEEALEQLRAFEGHKRWLAEMHNAPPQNALMPPLLKKRSPLDRLSDRDTRFF